MPREIAARLRRLAQRAMAALGLRFASVDIAGLSVSPRKGSKQNEWTVKEEENEEDKEEAVLSQEDYAQFADLHGLMVRPAAK